MPENEPNVLTTPATSQVQEPPQGQPQGQDPSPGQQPPQSQDQDQDPGQDLNQDQGRQEGNQPAPGFIPQYRYNAVKSRAQELEQQVRELQQRLQQTAQAQTPAQAPAQPAVPTQDLTSQIRTLAAEMARAQQYGEVEKAAELQAQIFELQLQHQQQVLQAQTQQSAQIAAQQAELANTVAKLEQTFPALNPESPQFDEDMSKEVLDVYEGLVATGKPPAEAMERAATLVVRAYQGNAPQTTPAPSGRTQENLQTVANALNQPQVPTGAVGAPQRASDGLPNPENMSQEDYEALPEETRKRLLGLA